jgi:hypothetical protein
VVARWLSAILTIAFVVLGSRPAADANPWLDGGDSEVSEPTALRTLVRASKRSGVRTRDTRCGSPGSLPPAILPDEATLPTRDQAPIDETIEIATEHDPRGLDTASARGPPRS